MTICDSGYDTGWKDTYSSMIKTAQEAVKEIRPGQRVFIGTGCGQPQILIKALLDRAKELEGTEVIHLVTFPGESYFHEELAKNFYLNSFFIKGNAQPNMQRGLGDYTPLHLSDIPKLFHSGRLPVDIALIQTTPPNKQGICSLGISVDIVKDAAENAGLVIAQVNPQMPWTAPDGLVYVHDIDILVPAETNLLEAALPVPTETSYRIAEYIAALIENGSTLQIGVDNISAALVKFLKNKHDLGIHSEVITDTIIELVESGIVTGLKKNTDRGKVVASFCIGTRMLYDYINNNPIFAIRSTDHVSDPYLIKQHNKMVALSTAIEVDLTGHVCTGSLKETFFSGMTGDMDFIRGAAGSIGGKVIIAMDSTRANNTISRITARLSQNTNVTITWCDVHYVVTEFGVAYLHGKSLQERALALISIAHPDFRGRLLKEAIESNYVSSDLSAAEGKVLIGPHELKTSHVLKDGTQINCRCMHPTDEKRTRDLFCSLSKDTIYYRFMSHITKIPQKQIQNFVYIDYRSDFAIVATLSEAHGEDIIAIGRYYLDPKTNLAEAAFIVRDKWQNRGIGTFLLKYLITIAKRNGIAGFTAEILCDNKPMLAVFQKSGCKINSHLSTEDRVYSIELDFT